MFLAHTICQITTDEFNEFLLECFIFVLFESEKFTQTEWASVLGGMICKQFRPSKIVRIMIVGIYRTTAAALLLFFFFFTYTH